MISSETSETGKLFENSFAHVGSGGDATARRGLDRQSRKSSLTNPPRNKEGPSIRKAGSKKTQQNSSLSRWPGNGGPDSERVSDIPARGGKRMERRLREIG